MLIPKNVTRVEFHNADNTPTRALVFALPVGTRSPLDHTYKGKIYDGANGDVLRISDRLRYDYHVYPIETSLPEFALESYLKLYTD